MRWDRRRPCRHLTNRYFVHADVDVGGPSGHPERGASMVEYAIAAAILVIVFIIIAQGLKSSSETRFESSTRAMSNIVPCDGQLSGEDCL